MTCGAFSYNVLSGLHAGKVNKSVQLPVWKADGTTGKQGLNVGSVLDEAFECILGLILQSAEACMYYYRHPHELFISKILNAR